MPSMLLTVAVMAAVAVAALSAGEPVGPSTRGTPRRARQLRPAAALRRQDVADLDGLVEKSHLFTADPEAASAGRLYRQLARYPSEPDTQTQTEAELTTDELLIDDGDFGRRLEPDEQSPVLPAYPPYSHGPLAVPVEPYRSPEYGPVSGEARQSAAAEDVTSTTAAPAERPAAVTETAEPTEVPLQGAEPPPAPREEVTDRPQPAGYTQRGPAPRRPYLPRPRAPARPVTAHRPPLKVAAPSLYKPGAVVAAKPPTSFYEERLNEVSSFPLWTPYAPLWAPYPPRPHSPTFESGHHEVQHRPASPEYRHYSGLRQAKKASGFERPHPSPHRYSPVRADVSFGARTGDHGAFEWFSDHPVGSAYH
ncbi:extensin-like [Amphibalanus amphitrite]|uniref:extensin-like n=1 Tax=Amphibalanus amphitrite TaxID=1232801 RepID=UPI001C9192E7|nr:extensin-like [Amphibalanus amphitrite]